MIKAISALFFCCFLLFSCGEVSKGKMLIGKWKFKQMERMDSTEAVDSSEADIQQLNKLNEGFALTFNEDNSFEVKQFDQTAGKGEYKLVRDPDFIVLKGNDGKETKWQIIKLEKNKLVLNTDPRSFEFLAFEKTD